MPRALRPHAGPGALPSARPAPFQRAVSFALLALGGALLWSAPAEAQTATVLISNTGQTTNTDSYPLTDTFNKLAQSFTAGTNGTGYTVDSVGIDSLASPTPQLRVTLNNVATGEGRRVAQRTQHSARRPSPARASMLSAPPRRARNAPRLRRGRPTSLSSIGSK